MLSSDHYKLGFGDYYKLSMPGFYLTSFNLNWNVLGVRNEGPIDLFPKFHNVLRLG